MFYQGITLAGKIKILGELPLYQKDNPTEPITRLLSVAKS